VNLISGSPVNTPAILAPNPSAIPVLLDLLHAEDFRERDLAIKFVMACPRKSSQRDSLIKALLDAAQDKDPRFAQEARRALVTDLEPLPKEAVPTLIEALKDDSMCIGARFALERVGPEAVPALS
jgi:hypothetical protein